MGVRPACSRLGVPPRNPFQQAELFIGHLANTSGQMGKTMTLLELEDVHLLERFYNQLCLLVEAQRASEPLSLLVIQLVCMKNLLSNCNVSNYKFEFERNRFGTHFSKNIHCRGGY